MTDPRQDYTPTRLLVVGRRMTDDYSVDDAVADYLRMHPAADEAQVRAELAQVDA